MAARARRWLAGTLATAMAAAVVTAATGRPGDRAQALDLNPATAWFASTATSSLALLDGPTATRVGNTDAGGPPGRVTQGPASSAYVHSGGVLRRVDGATQELSAANIPFGPDDRVVVVGKALWTIERGGTFVHDRDPVTLDSNHPAARFPGVASSAVGDDEGRLWVAGGSEVASFVDGRMRTRNALAGMSRATVLRAGDATVVVDAAAATAVVLDTASGRPGRAVCAEVAADAALSGSVDSPWVLAVAADLLWVLDLAADCPSPVTLEAPAGSRGYGPAVERGGRVYVPDRDRGRVLAVDPRVTPPTVRSIDVGLPDRPFELMSHRGFVWFDDPAGDTAGVITDDDTAIAASKGERAADGKPVSGTDPVDPDVACLGPAQVRVDQPVTFSVESALDPAPVWRWASPGGVPQAGTGLSHTTAWATPGTRHVEVADAGGGPHAATCVVRVSAEPPPEPPWPPQPPPPRPTPPPPVDDPTPPTTTTTSTTTTTTTTVPPAAPVDALVARFGVVPDPAIAGEPVRLADATEGAHRVVGWTFEGADPPTAASAEATATWARPGTYTVTLTVERDGAATSASRDVVVKAPGGLTVAVGRLADATLLQPYRQALSATGGLAPFTWAVTAGTLPPGLSLDPSTGEVTGTPTSATAADAAVTVAVTDAAGQKASRDVGVFVGLADRWRAVASMSTPREGHSVTMLQDGRILVAGGRDVDLRWVSSAEIFDPRTESWSPTGGMTEPRSSHTATLLNDGRVLVTGDPPCSPCPSSSELYSPSTGTWRRVAAGQLPRGQHTATLLRDGTVLLAGGYSGDSNGGIVAQAEIFDPSTETFRATGAMAVARHLHTATVLPDGRVIAVGGIVASTTYPGEVETTTTSEYYDPASRTWSAGPSLRQRRAGQFSASTGTTLVVGGGYGDYVSGGIQPLRWTDSVERMDWSTGTWVTTSPQGRLGGSPLVPLRDGRVLKIDGIDRSEVYDLVSGSWSPAASRGEGRVGGTVEVLPDGRVIVVGGYTGSSATAAVEIYG